jgi:type VI secretion system protein ImpE
MSMNAKQMYEAGHLTQAVAEVTGIVKARPSDTSARTFLFELLCFDGQLDRAEKQLDAIGQLDSKSEWGVQVFHNIVAAERARRRLFSDGLKPQFVLDPPAYIQWHLEAINRIREGNYAEAQSLLDRSESERPETPGTLNGKRFDDLRDCDDVLAPVLELMVLQDYIWLPFEQIRSIEITPPERPRDLIWAPVRLVTADGVQRSGYVPALYHRSHEHEDELLKLGRATDWSTFDDGPTVGYGMRTLLAGDDAVGILECRQLELTSG